MQVMGPTNTLFYLPFPRRSIISTLLAKPKQAIYSGGEHLMVEGSAPQLEKSRNLLLRRISTCSLGDSPKPLFCL
jgi:hypothetical protein